MNLSTNFKRFSKSLSNLPDDILDNIDELVISYRQSELSMCAITFDYNTFKKMVPGLPGSMTRRPNGSRYGVDLESIGTEKLRVYLAPPSRSSEISLYGYYVDQNARIYETKEYRRSVEYKGMDITRYDKEYNVIGDIEHELWGDRSYWEGPSEIIDIINENNFGHAFYKKAAKDQCYIWVHNRNV